MCTVSEKLYRRIRTMQIYCHFGVYPDSISVSRLSLLKLIFLTVLIYSRLFVWYTLIYAKKNFILIRCRRCNAEGT